MSLAVCPWCGTPRRTTNIVFLKNRRCGVPVYDCCGRARSTTDAMFGHVDMEPPRRVIPPSAAPSSFPAAALRWDWEPR